MGGRYLARSVGQAVLTILAIVVLNFILFRMMPGSPERVLLRNQYLTQEKIDQVRAEWGLDKPLDPGPAAWPIVQPRPSAATWATRSSSAARRSSTSSRPRFWPTIILIGFAEVISIVVGLGLGAYAGWRRGGAGDRVGSGAQPHPLLDAVLRHRDAADHHLRRRPSAGSPRPGC